MKIASRIHPKNGKSRRYTMHEREYIFAPEKDSAGTTHFVAEVTEQQHAEDFLGHPAFYAFGTDLQVKPTLTKSPRAATEPKQADPVVHAPDTLEAATKLLQGTAAAIATNVRDSDRATIAAAIDLESAKQKPRTAVVDVLKLTLEGIDATAK